MKRKMKTQDEEKRCKPTLPPSCPSRLRLDPANMGYGGQAVLFVVEKALL
jgi:hypothetical protein